MRVKLYWVCVIAFIVVVIGSAIAYDKRNDAECKALGGHTVDLYRNSICVSSDGRIIKD